MIQRVELMFCDCGCGDVFEGHADEPANALQARAERAGWVIVEGCDHFASVDHYSVAHARRYRR